MSGVQGCATLRASRVWCESIRWNPSGRRRWSRGTRSSPRGSTSLSRLAGLSFRRRGGHSLPRPLATPLTPGDCTCSSTTTGRWWGTEDGKGRPSRGLPNSAMPWHLNAVDVESPRPQSASSCRAPRAPAFARSSLTHSLRSQRQRRYFAVPASPACESSQIPTMGLCGGGNEESGLHARAGRATGKCRSSSAAPPLALELAGRAAVSTALARQSGSGYQECPATIASPRAPDLHHESR